MSLHDLLPGSCRAECAVDQRAERPVGEANGRDEVLARIESPIFCGSALRAHGDRHGTGEVTHEIEEVAAFAGETTTSDVWVVQPMVGRQGAGVDSNDHAGRTLNTTEVFPQLHCQGCESPVEPDHERWRPGLFELRLNLIELLLGQTQRFFDEDRLACPECPSGQGPVEVMARRDEDGGKRIVCEELTDLRCAAGEAELFRSRRG
jgi:hypothetical protein